MSCCMMTFCVDNEQLLYCMPTSWRHSQQTWKWKSVVMADNKHCNQSSQSFASLTCPRPQYSKTKKRQKNRENKHRVHLCIGLHYVANLRLAIIRRIHHSAVMFRRIWCWHSDATTPAMPRLTAVWRLWCTLREIAQLHYQIHQRIDCCRRCLKTTMSW